MKPSKTYRVSIFYKRNRELKFKTEQEARRWIKARALTNRAICYTELWEEDEKGDGEQIAVFENDSF